MGNQWAGNQAGRGVKEATNRPARIHGNSSERSSRALPCSTALGSFLEPALRRDHERPYHPRRMLVRTLTGASATTGRGGIRGGRTGAAAMTSGETA